MSNICPICAHEASAKSDDPYLYRFCNKGGHEWFHCPKHPKNIVIGAPPHEREPIECVCHLAPKNQNSVLALRYLLAGHILDLNGYSYQMLGTALSILAWKSTGGLGPKALVGIHLGAGNMTLGFFISECGDLTDREILKMRKMLKDVTVSGRVYVSDF